MAIPLDQPLYGPAKNLSWILGTIVIIIVIYILARFFKKKK